MTETLLEAAALARYDPFRDRVLVAVVQAARDVSSEATSDNPDIDRLRQALAVKVINQPEQYAERFAWAVIANPAITLAATDSDLQYTVNSVWNAVAGINTNTGATT